MEAQTRKMAANLDTDFLKIIAIITMAIDHVGAYLFPENIYFRIIGRIAFPIFAYCIAVGCLHTRDFKKYISRLAAFAIISQPFSVLVSLGKNATWEMFLQNITVLNIFFTLILGAFAIRGMMVKKYWITVIAVLISFFVNVDYGYFGVLLILIFYLCRSNRLLSLIIVGLWLVLNFSDGYFYAFGIVFPFGLQAMAVMCLPFIYMDTNFHPKINKYFFYAFYPLHLLVIHLVNMFLI